VRTERTREEDTSARPCQREPTWTSRSIKKTLDAALLLINDRVIPDKILEHES
jgi:hypothetical protein